MPRIRVLQSVAGPDFSWSAGDEIDVPAAEAQAWADGERAELVTDTPHTEQTATRSRGGGRGRRAETRDE